MLKPPPLLIKTLSSWNGRTIESILRHEFRLSRKQVIALKKCNGVTLNGRPVLIKEKLSGGEDLVIQIPINTTQNFLPEKIPLSIIYEDPDLIIIDKPAGLLVHPVRYHQSGTLANALAYHWQVTGKVASFHPVHRLDKLTSGLLLVAKSSWAHQQLSLQIKEEEFHRLYLAITKGIPPATSGEISFPIKRGQNGIKRIIEAGGQPAITRYRVIRQSKDSSLLAIRLITGRTHQIRVHLSHLGAALWGDPLYGASDEHLLRPALHAASLRFKHPRTHKLLTFKSPLPEDLCTLGESLNLI